jgi:hypothetical protein
MTNNSSTSKSLLILLWNANGLHNHLNDLQLTLHEKRIDIALISETHSTTHNKTYIPGYTCLHTNHPDGTAHGGASIFIKSSILFHPLPPYNEPHIQANSIQITLDHTPITITSTYCPPRHTISPLQFELFFNTLGNNFIVGGDLNAKQIQWGCHSNSPRGNTLQRITNNKNYNILSPPSPTYWPTSPRKRPDILDIFITKIPNRLNCTTENLQNPMSDHSPVLLIINTEPPIKLTRPSLINGVINWDTFQLSLSNQIDLKIRLKTNNDIDEAVYNLTTSIQSAAWSSCTPKPVPNQNYHTMPSHIRNLIVQKRRARTTWQRTRYPSDKRIYNNLCTTLKREVGKQRSDDFNKYTASLSEKDGSLWRATRRILKHKTTISPLKKQDGTWAINDTEKAETFRNHLAAVFQPNHYTAPPPTNEIKTFLDSPLPLTLPPKCFSPSVIKTFIKNFPLGKSPGSDLITAEVARKLPNKAITQLTHIFNAILRLSYIPLQWKFSIIIMFPKPNKPTDNPASYRPISLLPFFSKLLEKLILKRIYPIITENKIIPNSQFGFREKHSTIHQIHRLADAIACSLEKKQYTSAVFLDVSQAFDKVWHPGLLYKLKKILPPSYYLLLKSYLNERSFAVSSGSEISNISPILAGVPQGAVLSPTLYNLYTADQPTHHDTSVAEYADDKVIYSTHTDPLTVSTSLQKHLDLLSPWYFQWHTKINESKSVNTTFTLKMQQPPPVSLNNEIIPNSDTVKYLGLYFDKKLNWAKHIHMTKLKLNRRLSFLRSTMGKTSKLNLISKINLYKLLIKPIWTYGIQLWGAAKKTNINKIQVVQSKTLRLITNAPPYVSNETLHSDLNIPYVNEVAKNHYFKFHNRLQDHTNPLIKDLSSHSLPGNTVRRLQRKWPRDWLA